MDTTPTPNSEIRIVPLKLDGKPIGTAWLWPDGTAKLMPDPEYRALLSRLVWTPTNHSTEEAK